MSSRRSDRRQTPPLQKNPLLCPFFNLIPVSDCPHEINNRGLLDGVRRESHPPENMEPSYDRLVETRIEVEKPGMQPRHMTDPEGERGEACKTLANQ